MLKPGTYKLASDLKNPRPDRRYKTDWRFQETWGADTEFLVKASTRRSVDPEDLRSAGIPEEKIAQIVENNIYTTIHLVGARWDHQCIGPGNEESYVALEAALVPVEESTDAMFTRLGVRDYFARWLVETGRLTPKIFEQLWGQYQNEDEDASPQRPAFFVPDLDDAPLMTVAPSSARAIQNGVEHIRSWASEIERLAGGK